MSGSAPTIAEHLVARLVEAGARYVFGVPGDYNLRLLDAIEARPELEWVGNANEPNRPARLDTREWRVVLGDHAPLTASDLRQCGAVSN